MKQSGGWCGPRDPRAEVLGDEQRAAAAVRADTERREPGVQHRGAMLGEVAVLGVVTELVFAGLRGEDLGEQF